MSSILVDVRQPLATALASVAASVYATPPEAIIAPACSIRPGTPYLSPSLINQSTTKVKINLIVSAIVAYNNNSGALDNLDKLMIQIYGAMPSNFAVGDFSSPAIITVGTGNFLTADLDVYTYYQQT